MSEISIDIYFDGACKNVKDSREEPFGVGVAVFINKEYSELYSRWVHGRDGTSNIAEWTGCTEAMELGSFLTSITEKHFKKTPTITIYSDSELITKQFNGDYQIRQIEFKPYYTVAKELASQFNYQKIVWVPREQNTKADELSKIGLRNGVDEKVTFKNH